MPRPGLPLAGLLLLAPAAFGQAPVTRADLRPGLAFTVADAADGPPVSSRVDPSVGLTLAPGEAPHPRSAGGRVFRWRGYLNVLQPGPYRFEASVLGTLSVTVGGREVLAGSATGADPAKDAKWVEGPDLPLAAGLLPVEATLTRTGPAARVELVWRGPGFRPEPVPYYALGHVPSQRPALFAADTARDHGRLLFEELACARCHQTDPADKANRLTDRTGPNLAEVGKRVYPGWFDAWLADPHKLRPHTTMPRMFADDATGRAEQYAVARYLSGLGGPPAANPPASVKDYLKSADEGRRLYLATGCAACHGDKLTAPPTARKPKDDDDDKPALQPEDSLYGVGTGAVKAVYQLGAVGSKFTVPALSAYLKNPLLTNPHGRMPNMVLSDREAEDIAKYLCRQVDDSLSKAVPPEPEMKATALYRPVLLNYLAGMKLPIMPDEFAKMEAGRQWQLLGSQVFHAKRCYTCHADTPGGRPFWAMLGLSPSLDAVRTAGNGHGCLSPTPEAGQVPDYKLDAGRRAALAAFLADGPGGTPAPTTSARLAIRRFSCLACHNREGEGGLDEPLADLMKTAEKAENADDVQPPRLTGVGHKLLSPHLKGVLLQASRARPWLGLRMPQYGADNVSFLVDAVPKQEGTVPQEQPDKPELTAIKVEAGRNLAGKTGLGCVACHDISGIPGGGTRGPDLATAHLRVRRDWYGRWMHQPQRLAPGTRMPTYFPDGKSQLPEPFGGSADGQIAALWAYFALGPGLPLPPGTEPPGKALVVPVAARPVVLRTFLPDGAGTKAVAVGYPGGVNLAFDAGACRTVFGWTGNFLDANPVWANRGGAPAKLLGPKFWDAPAGFPWAVTDSRTPPDFGPRAADPAYGFQPKDDPLFAGPRFVHFGGYKLDPAGGPTFRYRLDAPDGSAGLAVEETPTPLPMAVAAGFARRFAVSTAAGRTAWFHAADAGKEPRLVGPDGTRRPLDLTGGAVEVPAAGVRVVAPLGGDRAVALEVLAAPAGTVWHFAPRPGGWAVLVRLPEVAGRADLGLAVWGLPRDDEGLVAGLRR